MSTIWESMGFIRWPLSFSALVVAGLALWGAAQLFRPGAVATLRTKVWVDAILFWGGFAVVSGVLGTLMGMVIASMSIEAANGVSQALLWGGLKVALLSSVAGVLILAGASLSWFVLQLRWRLLRAAEPAGA